MPLSFTPAKRFSRLSVKSPTMEATTVARHSTRNDPRGTLNQKLPATATGMHASNPPSTPSQVLPGETDGARRRRPKRRPAKYAPVSASQTSTRQNSTGAERRLSNFLLWNLAYAELYFSDLLWPDFEAAELARALAFFAGRERRFGQAAALSGEGAAALKAAP